MNEYTKLLINGVERPLCFKAGSIRILKKQFGYDIFELLQSIKGIGDIASYLPEIVYSAMGCYCSIEKKPVDFTIEDVTEWLDAFDTPEITKLMGVITTEYIDPLKGLVKPSEKKEEKADSTSGEVKEKEEPFLMDGDRKDVSGSNDDAPVGTRLVQAQRPRVENIGVH